MAISRTDAESLVGGFLGGLGMVRLACLVLLELD